MLSGYLRYNLLGKDLFSEKDLTNVSQNFPHKIQKTKIVGNIFFCKKKKKSSIHC